MRAPALLALLLAGCAHDRHDDVRFRIAAPVWRVNDREPLPAMPARRVYGRALYYADGYVARYATRVMALAPHAPAEDINSLGEVPDSSWFTNRIGTRALTLDQLRRGPNRDPGPFALRPWTIRSRKSGGTALGFIFEDARGDAYLLKFDDRDYPEMETAAHVIVQRILWACGYNVPEDYLGTIRREDLQIAPNANTTHADVTSALTRVARTPDGRYRVIASRFVEGTPIGPYAREGTRADDPNDRIPHERRRSLRGQYAIFAWLNHTDVQEDNTLDAFHRGHVVHYLLDFGLALGALARDSAWPTAGYTYRFDPGIAIKSALGLGLWDRPWESLHAPALPGVGVFEVAHYDPGTWRSNSPYWPLEDKDRFDAFWGAKLVMRFTPAQLAALVAEGQLSDPRSAAYLVDTLVARQRKTARYWFERVAPLDAFRVDASRVCFSDLLLAYQLAAPATHYHVTTFDDAGRLTGPRHVLVPTRDGRACTGPIPARAADHGYTVAHVRVFRDGRPMPDVRVHLARGDDGRLAVVGLRRD